MDGEEWRAVSGYEGMYEVSNYGRVKSLARTARNGRKMQQTIMALKEWHGYWVIWLRNGKKRKYRINRLVAQAFIPNPGELPFVNHKDRDRKNNHYTNLEWCTPQGNTDHWMAHDAAAANDMPF